MFWRGWHDLRFDRQYGAFGGQSQISFGSIDGYARRYGIAGVLFETFKAVVLEMDNEYLLHVEREAEKASERNRTNAQDRQQVEQF